MPKVEQFGPSKVTTQVTRGARARDVAPGAFGIGGVAQGIQSVATGLDALGQRLDTTAAEEALVGFERAKNDIFFNPESGYFNKQGRDAFDGAKDTNDSLVKLQEQFRDTLSSDRARQMFSKSADVQVTRANADILRHSAKGLKSWEVATIGAQIENSLENGALYWNDPQRLRVNNALGRQSVIDAADLEGVGPEVKAERLQTFDSMFTRGAVEAATLSSSAAGQELLDEKGDLLEGADKLKLQKAIDTKQKTEETQFNAAQSVVVATRLNDQFDTRADIIEEVNKIEDDNLRKQTMSEAMQQFSRGKQAESEARGDAFEAAETHQANGGTAETFKATNPEAWELMSPKQQSSIQSGQATVTDWNTFSDLMLLPKSKLAKVDPTDHYPNLAPAERTKLISAVKTAGGVSSASQKADAQVGRGRTAQTKSAVIQVFGKESDWDRAVLTQVNGFYDLVDSEVRHREEVKDAPLTSAEYTDVLAGFTREVAQKRSFLGIDRLRADIELDITDVPAEDVPVLSRFLRDNGVPVTTDNLIKAHQQATQ